MACTCIGLFPSLRSPKGFTLQSVIHPFTHTDNGKQHYSHSCPGADMQSAPPALGSQSVWKGGELDTMTEINSAGVRTSNPLVTEQTRATVIPQQHWHVSVEKWLQSVEVPLYRGLLRVRFIHRNLEEFTTLE
ncbi:hypothetical protein CHARACLAT_005204 [Characodon lateralis]|uniref:Uncharacterized protein n=1 Tax=Characodon lateralis TaxID=208331 RepID=A0ABU7D6P4_9TELE|nr:hypothetical protein [Characodon lateralis]